MWLSIVNIRRKISNLNAIKNKTADEQLQMDIAVWMLVGDEHFEQRRGMSLNRCFGVTKAQFNRWKERQARGFAGSGSGMPKRPHSIGQSVPKDLTFVTEWFHTDCPCVSVNKERDRDYIAKPEMHRGQRVYVKCHPMLIHGTKKFAAESFLLSETYGQYVKTTGGELSLAVVQACMCTCMKSATVRQCVCPVCTEFEYALSAWDTQRLLWHVQEQCSCDGCAVTDRFSKYMLLSKSPHAFMDGMCCAKQEWPGLVLPHTPDAIPSFRCLSCCKVMCVLFLRSSILIWSLYSDQ
jgi:hypothetical protein